MFVTLCRAFPETPVKKTQLCHYWASYILTKQRTHIKTRKRTRPNG